MPLPHRDLLSPTLRRWRTGVVALLVLLAVGCLLGLAVGYGLDWLITSGLDRVGEVE